MAQNKSVTQIATKRKKANSAHYAKKNRIYNVAVIGLGKMGHIRIQEVKNNPNLRLVAVCDIQENLKDEFSGYRFNADYKKLQMKDIDIVFVATYNKFSPDIIIYALDHGKHVFCEKPPGTSVADVKRIIDAEKKNPDCKLKFGFNHRYHGSVIEAKSLIESGMYGKILWMRGIYGKTGGIKFENTWRSDKEIAGGGVLLDQGIHMLDLFRYFAGAFHEVKSLISTSYWNISVEDNAFAILRNKKGQVALLHSSATQWKHKFSLEIFLEDGYIILDGMLSSTRSYGDETLMFAKKQFEDKTFALGKPREEKVYFDTDNSWRLEIEELVESIENNTSVKNGSSEDALAVMKLIEKIYLLS